MELQELHAFGKYAIDSDEAAKKIRGALGDSHDVKIRKLKAEIASVNEAAAKKVRKLQRTSRRLGTASKVLTGTAAVLGLGIGAKKLYDSAREPTIKKKVKGTARAGLEMGLDARDLRRALTKQASKPKFRERAELWGVKGKKVLTGVYPDGSLGTYGGGVDPGETRAQGGQREYNEESGRKVKGVRQVGRPISYPWNFQEAGDPTARKRFAVRSKQFPGGSRTTHLVGTIHGRKGKSLAGETAPIKNIKFRNVSAAVKIQAAALKQAPSERKQKLRARLRVLQHLEKQVG